MLSEGSHCHLDGAWPMPTARQKRAQATDQIKQQLPQRRPSRQLFRPPPWAILSFPVSCRSQQHLVCCTRRPAQVGPVSFDSVPAELGNGRQLQLEPTSSLSPPPPPPPMLPPQLAAAVAAVANCVGRQTDQQAQPDSGQLWQARRPSSSRARLPALPPLCLLRRPSSPAGDITFLLTTSLNEFSCHQRGNKTPRVAHFRIQSMPEPIKQLSPLPELKTFSLCL